MVAEVPVAFSLDRVLFHGVNVVRAAPGPVLGAALLAAMAQLFPAAVSNVLSLVGTLAFPPGSEEGMILSLGSSAVQIVGLLFAVPLVPLFSYGSIAAVARWAAGEPITLMGILTSFIPVIRAFLYDFGVGIVRLVLLLLFVIPAVLLGVFAVFGGSTAMIPIGVAAVAILIVYIPVALFFSVRFALGGVIAAVDDHDGWPVSALQQTWQATGTGAGFLTVAVLGLIGGCADGLLGGLLGLFFLGIPLIAAVHAVLNAGMALAWLEASRPPEVLAQMPYFRDLTSGPAAPA
jgi:hypothetical protein